MPPPRFLSTPLTTLCRTCLRTRIRPPPHLTLVPSRPASHASQGRANKAAPGPGKRLGAKRAASELVVPGNIIFRQRGTHWFPGENCAMGRDHTIFAKEKGYVVYYRGEKGHDPDRKFIGVVFRRGDTLPVPAGKPRVRRLGLLEREREISTVAMINRGTLGSDAAAEEAERLEEGSLIDMQGTLRQQSVEVRKNVPVLPTLHLKEGYQYRESNWSIGRTAERAGVKVKEFRKKDRFAAWRRRAKAQKEAAEKRELGRGKKGKKANKKK